MMNRLLLGLLALSMLLACAQAEDGYDGPPVYRREAQLADLWAMAELVVVGTSGDGTLVVEKTLFGKSADLVGAKPVLPIGMGQRLTGGKQGVWFLARAPKGYVVLNPDLAAVSLAEFGKLPPPKDHWTSQPDLVLNRPSETQAYYTYTKAGGHDEVWHGTNVFGYSRGALVVELTLQGKHPLKLIIDSHGARERIGKYPETGDGFLLDYDKGHLVEFIHFRDGKKHGLFRRYFRSNPEQLREEKSFTDGVIDGRSREWQEDGTLIRDEVFSYGLILPIVRYTGDRKGGVTAFLSGEGIAYAYGPAVAAVKVGMSTQEVSDILKVDFSPTQGVMFRTFTLDTYLFIGFKDGKVSEISTGHNGNCIMLAE